MLELKGSTLPCAVCGSTVGTHDIKCDAKTRQPLAIKHCHQCGHIQLADRRDNESLEVYYSHHYRADYKQTYEPKTKHIYRAGRASINRLRFIIEHTGSGRSAQLIDIGAGGGEFVYLANRFGFQATGIEPNVGYSEFARISYGVSVETTTVEKMSEGSADVITLFHVLEHIAEPTQVAEQLWRCLRTKGHLVIEVPNILEPGASPSNIYFEAHVHYFSRFTLEAALSPYFELRAMHDDGNLIAVFERRDQPLEGPILPTAQALQMIQKRLKTKGWLEYLTVGGGAFKFARRLKTHAREQKISGSPRHILDQLFNAAA